MRVWQIVLAGRIAVRCPDMTNEGCLWFPNLLLPDVTLLLPLLCCSGYLLTIQVKLDSFFNVSVLSVSVTTPRIGMTLFLAVACKEDAEFRISGVSAGEEGTPLFSSDHFHCDVPSRCFTAISKYLSHTGTSGLFRNLQLMLVKSDAEIFLCSAWFGTGCALHHTDWART